MNFDYKPLSRTTNSKTKTRLYETPDGGRLPSVTTILGKTADKTYLHEWRKRVGDKEATRITQEAANHGTLIHKNLENKILKKPPPKGNNLIHKNARTYADIIEKEGMSKITEIWGTEVPLYFPQLYAGTADLIGLHNGIPALIDFKNSRKMKKEEWVTDYYLQGCAYALAHNELFETNIQKVVIFMVARDPIYGQFKEFVIEGDAFEEKLEMWLNRIEKFYKHHGTVNTTK